MGDASRWTSDLDAEDGLARFRCSVVSGVSVATHGVCKRAGGVLDPWPQSAQAWVPRTFAARSQRASADDERRTYIGIVELRHGI